jgi:hypothetical protein
MSKIMRVVGFAAVAIGAGYSATASSANNIDGRWAAVITEGTRVIPFRLDISGSGNHLVGKLFNGAKDYETTTSAKFKDGAVELNFEHYLTSITATVKDGELDGQLVVKRRSPINITPGQAERKVGDDVNPFHARRYVAPSAAALANVPQY